MGKKYPPQAFVGIPAGDFFLRGDGDGELFPDGEFPIAISILAAASGPLPPSCSFRLFLAGLGIKLPM